MNAWRVGWYRATVPVSGFPRDRRPPPPPAEEVQTPESRMSGPGMNRSATGGLLNGRMLTLPRRQSGYPPINGSKGTQGRGG